MKAFQLKENVVKFVTLKNWKQYDTEIFEIFQFSKIGLDTENIPIYNCY